jgi:hypothetical protein
MQTRTLTPKASRATEKGHFLCSPLKTLISEQEEGLHREPKKNLDRQVLPPPPLSPLDGILYSITHLHGCLFLI